MIIIPDPPYKFKNNRPLIVVCIAKGLPPPDVKWCKNSTCTEAAQNDKTLILYEFSEDSTMHTCVASNTVGNRQRVTKKKITIDPAWYVYVCTYVCIRTYI